MKVKREKSTSTKGHYVKNSDLLPAVLHAKSIGRVTDELISMIENIADRYSRKHNFIGYSYREDMVAAAVLNLCNNALKFNPEKSSNPFSFYTTAINNSFLQYLADEKNHRKIRDALLVDNGANPSFAYAEQDREEHELALRDSQGTVLSEEALIDIDTAERAYTDTDIDKPVMSPRGRARQPGDIKVWKPEDTYYDPETGAVCIREGAVPTIIAAKPITAYKPKKPQRGRPPKNPEAAPAPKKEKIEKVKAPKKEPKAAKPAKKAAKTASKKAK